MRTLRITNLKLSSLFALILLFSTFGCEKENIEVTPVTKNQVYVYENVEYTVKMVKEGNDFVPVENETTKMLDAAMENPTSSTYVDLKTSKTYLFCTSEEADKFIEKIKNMDPSKKKLKSGDFTSIVSYYLAAYQDTSSIVYDAFLCDILVSRYNLNYYQDIRFGDYNCDDQISSLIISASKDYDVFVTLCENPGGINSSGHRLYFKAAKGPYSNSVWVNNLNDYVMVRKLGIVTKRWNDQASSVYYGLD